MKLIECLAPTLLLAAATAGAELTRPAGTVSSAASAAQREEIEEGIAAYSARISEDLERRVEVLIASHVAMHMADAAPEPPQHVARTD
jgi:hypothetical protein